MKLAAAHAIAGIISENELQPEYIIPSVFDKRVAEAVTRAVEEAAYQAHVARRDRNVTFSTCFPGPLAQAITFRAVGALECADLSALWSAATCRSRLFAGSTIDMCSGKGRWRQVAA